MCERSGISMTRLDFAFIALVCLLILGIALCARAGERQAYLVCEGRCLQGVTLGPKAKLIVPTKDGKPDYSKAILRGVVVDVNHSLEQVEIQGWE